MSNWYLVLCKCSAHNRPAKQKLYTAWNALYSQKSRKKQTNCHWTLAPLLSQSWASISNFNIGHPIFTSHTLDTINVGWNDSVRASSNHWSWWHLCSYRWSDPPPVCKVSRIFVPDYIGADSMFRMVHSVLWYWSHHFVVDRSLGKSTQRHRDFCKLDYPFDYYHHRQLANSHLELELVQAKEQQIQFQLQQLKQKMHSFNEFDLIWLKNKRNTITDAHAQANSVPFVQKTTTQYEQVFGVYRKLQSV